MKIQIIIPELLVGDANKIASHCKVGLEKWASELVETQIVQFRTRYMLDGWTEDMALIDVTGKVEE